VERRREYVTPITLRSYRKKLSRPSTASPQPMCGRTARRIRTSGGRRGRRLLVSACGPDVTAIGSLSRRARARGHAEPPKRTHTFASSERTHQIIPIFHTPFSTLPPL